jgi:hypothetical protein
MLNTMLPPLLATLRDREKIMTENKNAYNAGIMAKQGKDFHAEFFAEDNQVVKESNAVVLVLMKSDEIDAIIDEMILKTGLAENPTITVEDRAGFWWIKADGKIEIDANEAGLMLGKKFTVYDVLVNVSSTIGRAYTLGDKFIITSELMGLDVKLTDI